MNSNVLLIQRQRANCHTIRSSKHFAMNVSAWFVGDDNKSTMDSEKLIEAVQANPLLYDLNNKKYVDKTLRDQAWDRVATIVKAPVDVCKASWFTLRSSYARYLRSCLKTGSKRRCEWHHSQRMAFLRPFLKIRVHPESFDAPEDCFEVDAYGFGVKVLNTDNINSSSMIAANKRDHQDPDMNISLGQKEPTKVQTPLHRESHGNSAPVVIESDTEERLPKISQVIHTPISIGGNASHEFYSLTQRSPAGNSLHKVEPDIPVCEKRIKLEDSGETDVIIPIYDDKPLEEEKQEQTEEEECNELLFLKTLIPDIKKLSESQKRKFKLSILTTLYGLLDDNS